MRYNDKKIRQFQAYYAIYVSYMYLRARAYLFLACVCARACVFVCVSLSLFFLSFPLLKFSEYLLFRVSENT